MEEKILKILKDIRSDSDFENSEDFIADDMLDSFDVIELVSNLEDTFDCKIDGLDIMPENFSNLKAIAEMVVKSGGAA